MSKFPSAGMLLGGYDQEERQPYPFVALDFPGEAEAASALEWLTHQETEAEILHLGIQSTSDGDLRVTVKSPTGEVVCEEEIWKDEMWQIFRELFRQVEAVRLMVSVGGVVQPRPSVRIPGRQVEMDVSG